MLGGRGGIRTRGRLLTYARFPDAVIEADINNSSNSDPKDVLSSFVAVNEGMKVEGEGGVRGGGEAAMEENYI